MLFLNEGKCIESDFHLYLVNVLYYKNHLSVVKIIKI